MDCKKMNSTIYDLKAGGCGNLNNNNKICTISLHCKKRQIIKSDYLQNLQNLQKIILDMVFNIA